MEKEKRVVRIAGKSYSLTTSDTQEHVERVVSLLNDRLDEAAALETRNSQETAVFAAALSIADELIKAQDDNTRLRRELSKAYEIAKT